jgi:hypothetical protein
MRNSTERPSAARRVPSRLGVHQLEDRLTPSWSSTPPAAVTPPTGVTAATLNSAGDASGPAAITANEVDWYKFTGTAGAYTISATGTTSLDTVIGVYTAAGQRVAFNDDISSANRNSRLTTNLSAGTYYLGVTNYVGTRGGSYTWAIDGPAAVSPPPTTPPTTPPPASPPPTTSGFTVQVRFGSGLTAGQQAVFSQAAARWAQVITGDLPDATYNGTPVDDVLIDASGVAIDGPNGVLGQAGPDRLRSGSYLPIHGTMQFDTADLAALEANGGLYYTILHEMGHVLGIGTIWQNEGLLAGAGGADPRFVGRQATAAYNAIFGRNETGVPVENSGGAGTRDGHWREATFGNEIMTGYLNGGTNPLSRVTVAALADMGYTVNLAAADAYTPPAGAALVSGGGTTTGGRAGLVAGGGATADPGGASFDLPVATATPTTPSQPDRPARRDDDRPAAWVEHLAAAAAGVRVDDAPSARHASGGPAFDADPFAGW